MTIQQQSILAVTNDDLRSKSPLHETVAALLSYGIEANPYSHPYSTLGLTSYMREFGVTHFSGNEIASPIRLRALMKDDNAEALPARWCWPRAAAICLVLEDIRSYVKNRINVLWWLRTPDVAVMASAKTATTTDHLTASAMDIQLDSARDWSIASRRIDELYASGVLGLSYGNYGAGSRKIHLGVFAPATIGKGSQRKW